MLRRSAILVAVVIAFITYPAAADDKGKPSMLADAVKEFNKRAQKNATGKDEPALTEDEVVAAIREWNPRQAPTTDEVYKVCQTIADAKKIPDGATLRFTTRLRTFNGYVIDVWWIDLDIKLAEGTRYTYRIRDRKLRSRPLAPKVE